MLISTPFFSTEIWLVELLYQTGFHIEQVLQTFGDVVLGHDNMSLSSELRFWFL